MSDNNQSKEAEKKTAHAEQPQGTKSFVAKKIDEMFSSELNLQNSLKEFIKDGKAAWLQAIVDGKIKKSDQDEKNLDIFIEKIAHIVKIQDKIIALQQSKLGAEEIRDLALLIKSQAGFYWEITQAQDKLGKINFNIDKDKGKVASQSYFMLPVQRLSRWVMLVEETLQKNEKTNEKEEERELKPDQVKAFQDLLIEVKKEAVKLNAAMARNDLFNALYVKDMKTAKEILDKNIKDNTLKNIQQVLDSKGFVDGFIKSGFAVITLGTPPEDMTAMQAAQQLSDYIKCGFEIKFESPQVAAQWNEKRIYTPDDESPIEVAPIVVDVSKGLMDDEILVTRIMQTTNQLNKNIRVFQLGETFKSKFDVLAKEKGNDEIIQSFTKNIVTPIDKENERKRKSKSEETPAVASQKEVVELKKAIAQGKLSTINSDKLAKTLEKLQQHPEAFVVKLSAPDPRMTGMEAAQKLSDYISCGFEISFSSPQTIEQWKKLINPEVGDIFAIKVNEFEGLKDDLLLMNRAANGVKVLLENGFKVVHVSEAYYEKLKDNTLNDEGVSQLLQNPLFVQLATVTGKVTPPPQPTRTSSAEKSVETSALQAEEISPPVTTIGQQPASTPQPRPRAASTSKAEQPLSPKKQLNRSKSFSGPLELPAAKVDVPEEPLPISRSASEVSLVQPSSKSVAVVVPASQTKAPPEPPKKEKRVLVQPESAPLLLSKLPQASIRLNTRNPQPKINIFDENQIKTFIKDLKAYRDSINTKKQDSFLHKLGMGKLEERSLQAGGLITALENSLESKDLSEVKESLLEVKRQIKNWRLPEKIYGKSQLQEKVDVIIHQLGLQEPEKNKKNTPNGSGA